MVRGALLRSQLRRFLILQDSEHEVLVFLGSLDCTCNVSGGEDARESVSEVGDTGLGEDDFLGKSDDDLVFLGLYV